MNKLRVLLKDRVGKDNNVKDNIAEKLASRDPSYKKMRDRYLRNKI